jgi:hypothetical protein
MNTSREDFFQLPFIPSVPVQNINKSIEQNVEKSLWAVGGIEAHSDKHLYSQTHY